MVPRGQWPLSKCFSLQTVLTLSLGRDPLLLALPGQNKIGTPLPNSQPHSPKNTPVDKQQTPEGSLEVGVQCESLWKAKKAPFMELFV